MAKIIKKLKPEETKFSSEELASLSSSLYDKKAAEALKNGGPITYTVAYPATSDVNKAIMAKTLVELYQDYLAELKRTTQCIDNVLVRDPITLEGFILYLYTLS